MIWLHETVSSPHTGRASSSRVIALAAGLTLCFSTVLLTIGSFWHLEMLPTLMAFGPSLAGMATIGYATNRFTTNKTTNQETGNDT